MDKQAGKFALEILNAATVAHILHLKSRSYAQHMALGELYEALPGLIDSVVEAYQGKYGIIDYPTATVKAATDAVAFAQDLSSFIATYRDFCEDSEIQNLIDSIAEQVDSTMYKLKFLA